MKIVAKNNKAHNRAHGIEIVQGVHYDETFTPIVPWTTVRLLLTLAQQFHLKHQELLQLHPSAPEINCKVFEDNIGAPKLPTQHIAINYHHFRSFVADKKIEIEHVDTKNQIADIATKALPRVQFEILRKKLLGW